MRQSGFVEHEKIPPGAGSGSGPGPGDTGTTATSGSLLSVCSVSAGASTILANSTSSLDLRAGGDVSSENNGIRS